MLTTNPDAPEVDKGIAVHEIGHALTYTAAGAKVDRVEILHDGGITYVHEPDPMTNGFLVGIMAGHVAEAMWLQREAGLSRRRALDVALGGTHQDDAEMFEAHNRTLRLYREDAISQAEKLIGRKWRRLEDLAEELYRTGRLPGSRF